MDGALGHSHRNSASAVARKQQKARPNSPMVTSMPLGNKVVDVKVQQKRKKKKDAEKPTKAVKPAMGSKATKNVTALQQWVK